MKTSAGVISKSLGQMRLRCFQLIFSIDFAIDGTDNLLRLISSDFWRDLVDMIFIHDRNNLYLYHFRQFVYLSMLFHLLILEYLIIKCNLAARLTDYYITYKKIKTVLH